MNKLLREPLLHFLLLGAVMFGGYQLASNQLSTGGTALQEIVISAGQLDALILGFEKVWQRLPSQLEMQGLVQNHIREEVMYREALAMGLEKNDSIIRRRLKQKLEFLFEDIASLALPSEDELQTFLVANPDRFREQSRFSLRHIYFNVGQRGDSSQADAEILLAKLREQSIDEHALASAGDRLLMTQSYFQNEEERNIRRDLGALFTQSLRDMPTGTWQGPIESDFGLHLVYIEEHIPGNLPALSDIRETVSREWNLVKRKEANEAFYQTLLENYTVTIATTDAMSPTKVIDKNATK